MTGSVEEWVVMHNNILKEELIKTILKDPLNFDANGIILDTNLDNYGINCINDCSGHGKCFKSKSAVLDKFYEFIYLKKFLLIQDPFCKLGVTCNNIGIACFIQLIFVYWKFFNKDFFISFL